MAFVGDVSIDNKKNQQMRVIPIHTHTHTLDESFKKQNQKYGNYRDLSMDELG